MSKVKKAKRKNKSTSAINLDKIRKRDNRSLVFLSIFTTISLIKYYPTELPDFNLAYLGMVLLNIIVSLIGKGLISSLSYYEKVLEQNEYQTPLKAVLIFPVLEEFVFRNLFLNMFLEILPISSAVLTTSVMFSMFHGTDDMKHNLYYILIGISLGYAFLFSGSVFGSIISHAIVNMIFVFIRRSIIRSIPFFN